MASLAAMHLRPRSIIPLGAVVVIAVSALALATCRGDDDPESGRGTADTTDDSSPADYEGSVDLEVGTAIIAGSGGEASLDRAVVKEVLATIGGYIDAAVVEPLLTGEAAKKLERFFGLRVVTRVMADGEDRPSLTDEGLPDVSADLVSKARPVDLDGLADPSGAVLMVGASLDLDITTATAEGPLTISRVGDLILEPDADGGWEITGYDIEVRRRSAGGSTTTAASTASTTEAP
ncbi:MAG: hypothetical protein M5T61_05180 [Acidimicrobiia bacterium]|nr:hypothetical protein [Acidimicrobiia bacterium]